MERIILNNVSGPPKAVRRNHLHWIDFAKGVAMIAVVFDHAFGFKLYSSDSFLQSTFFSVTLFILLSGITTIFSMQSKNIHGYDLKYVGRRLALLLIPYAIATLFYIVYQYQKFDLLTYLHALVTFTASPPFYFVLFFLQLILISPILYTILKMIFKSSHPTLNSMIFLIVMALLSYILTKYTYILPVHGGGQFLFGGSYLFIYALGMVFAFSGIFKKSPVSGAPTQRMNNKSITRRNFYHPLLIFAISLTCLILYLTLIFFNDSVTQMWNLWLPEFAINPPGPRLIIYSVLILFTVWSLYLLIDKCSFLKKLFTPIEVCGRYSLPIFLFHLLSFLIFFYTIPIPPIISENIWLYRIYMLSVAIILPIFIKWLVDQCKRKILSSYSKLDC